MLEIASAILLLLMPLLAVFVVAVYLIVWWRERNLPPEEKELRRQLRSGGMNKKQFYVFLTVRLAVFGLLIGIVIVSLLEAREKYQQQFESPVVSQTEREENEEPTSEAIDTSAWQTYRNEEFGIQFQYPSTYTIALPTNERPCSLIARPESSCVVIFTLIADNREYAPRGSFYLVEGVNSVNIAGQVQNIEFDVQMNAWVLKTYPAVDVLQIWGYTSFGEEIMKTSNGGSGGSSVFYIIPDHAKNVVAIFQIPSTRRLYCESMEQGLERDRCENFYQSVVNEYSRGEEMAQIWLPKGYFDAIYKDAEKMVSTLRFGE